MGSTSLNMCSVRAYTAIWAGAWHTEGMAGALGLLIPLRSWRAPQENFFLCLAGAFGVQGRADTSSARGVGTSEAAAWGGRAAWGC